MCLGPFVITVGLVLKNIENIVTDVHMDQAIYGISQLTDSGLSPKT